MTAVAIVAGGPLSLMPDLNDYKDRVTIWIGADRGAKTIIDAGITLDYAIGDFDSITKEQLDLVKKKAINIEIYPVEKDETDLELAISKALELTPDTIYFFGVTGGRLDHGLVSLQLLYPLLMQSVKGIIVDINNSLEMYASGKYEVENTSSFPYISFLPFSSKVSGISLEGFYYKLSNAEIYWGSTRCISNKLTSEKGTFSFKQGILLLVKSRDVLI